jgi:hypothetical protein
MVCLRHILTVLCLAIFSLSAGCKSKSESEIVCHMLYQKSDSFTNALKFIEMPEDRIESSLSILKQKGELADRNQLVFANKLFSLRKSKDVDLFKSLLSKSTKSQLEEEDNNQSMVHQYLRQVEDGTFLYGMNDVKFFATVRRFTDEDREKFEKHVRFADTPTYVIDFWHRHKPGPMLIGSSFYLIKEKGSYKLVAETLLQGQFTIEAEQSSTVMPNRQVSLKEGPALRREVLISLIKVDDAYTRDNIWKYNWKIELSPAETVDNKFEMLKLTEIISVQGHADINPEVARQVLIKGDVFEKYKGGQLRFKFYIGDKEPIDNVTQYGLHLTRWDYGFSIANFSDSGLMYFPGTEIMNVVTKKDAKFIGSNLELMSFETEKDSVKYKNRIVLSKTPPLKSKSATD